MPGRRPVGSDLAGILGVLLDAEVELVVIDFLGEMIGGGTHEDVAPHTEILSVFGRQIRVLDLPSLIRAKRAAGRPKDLEALAELEALLAERERSG